MNRLSPSRTDADARSSRGQTSFDFLVGMSVFLLTLGITFTFVPGMFQPFDTGTGPNMVVADRSASLLAEDLLVEDVARPGVLNATCTEAFFDDEPDPSDCRFEHNGSELHGALLADGFTGLNVTVESDGVIETVGGGSVALEAGPPLPSSADVVIAKRVVLVAGDQMTLYVRVW